MASDATSEDPILAKRAKIATYVKIGKRGGYGLFLYAIVAFGVGAAVGFSVFLTDTIAIALLIGSIMLIPAIVFGYGLRAAERDERQRAAAADQTPTAASKTHPPNSQGRS